MNKKPCRLINCALSVIQFLSDSRCSIFTTSYARWIVEKALTAALMMDERDSTRGGHSHLANFPIIAISVRPFSAMPKAAKSFALFALDAAKATKNEAVK